MEGAPDLDLVILGAGARWPTPERGVAAFMVMRGADHVLIDCGEGTQLQMMRSVAGLRRLALILISHCHADHVLGLPGLLATLSEARTEPLTILGPAGIGHLVDGFRVHFGALAFPLTIREVEPGDVERREGYRLTAVAASHRTPSLAWSLEEDPLPGHLLPEALLRLGVPAGPERAALARGDEAVLAGGRRIVPGQVMGPRRPGRRIVFSGDTRPAPAVREAASGRGPARARGDLPRARPPRSRSARAIRRRPTPPGSPPVRVSACWPSCTARRAIHGRRCWRRPARCSPRRSRRGTST